MSDVRNETQRVNAEPISVVLGGKPYAVRPANLAADKRFREIFAESLKRLDALSVLSEVARTGSAGNVDLSPLILSFLEKGIDDAASACIAYSPELQADEERIRADANMDEWFTAIVDIFELAAGPFVRGILKVAKKFNAMKSDAELKNQCSNGQ